MALANINTSDFIKGSGVTQTGRVIEITGGGTGLQSGTASGTDTYAVTIGTVASYTAGDAYVVKFTNANSGASTININTLGAKGLKKSVSTALASGDILAGQEFIIVYDGTNFQVIGISSGGTSITVGDTQVLYADGANTPVGEAAFTYNKTTNVLTVDGINLNGKTASRFVTTDASKNLDTPYTFIDDDTMATASPTAIPSSESVKAYYDQVIELEEFIYCIGSFNYTQR